METRKVLPVVAVLCAAAHSPAATAQADDPPAPLSAQAKPLPERLIAGDPACHLDFALDSRFEDVPSVEIPPRYFSMEEAPKETVDYWWRFFIVN